MRGFAKSLSFLPWKNPPPTTSLLSKAKDKLSHREFSTLRDLSDASPMGTAWRSFPVAVEASSTIMEGRERSSAPWSEAIRSSSPKRKGAPSFEVCLGAARSRSRTRGQLMALRDSLASASEGSLLRCAPKGG